MADILKTIHRIGRKFDSEAERFVWRHPFLGFFSLFVGMPLFVLACVCISTVIIIFPIASFFGWL